jgi:hypothetical protein
MREKCNCGQPLPLHLAELAPSDGSFKHVCSCEIRWKWDGSDFIEDGSEPNPFARYDEEQRRKLN